VYGRNCAQGVQNPQYVQMVDAADAVFFTGGLSGNIQECLFGGHMNGTETPILAAIRKKEIVAGTSAGAMVQPVRDIMITGITCESYQCVSARSVYHRKDGFELFTHGLVDVHYAERGRQGRLYVLAWQTKTKYSFGVDENTALIQYPDGTMKVMGQNGVLVYDQSKQNMTTFESGITVHFLTEGDSIDANGNITFASTKKKCSTSQVPKESHSIFADFRSRSIDVAMYEKPDYEYKGFVGASPVIQVSLKRKANTVAVCGDNRHSFSNLFMAVSTKSFDELGFFAADAGVEVYPYDV
jgi:cyanophycinase